MGAAARSYGGGGGSKGDGRPAPLPLEKVPRLQDRNPYRLKHGLVVFDRSAQNTGKLGSNTGSLVPPFLSSVAVQKY